MTDAARGSKAAKAATEAFQWQAAMGAVAGAAVAEAHVQSLAAWGPLALATAAHAERWLTQSDVALDLAPAEALAVAVGLSGHASPLLVDPATVELIDHMRAWLEDDPIPPFVDRELAVAAERAVGASDFMTAIESAASVGQASLVGGLFGLRHGLGAIPARMVSELADDDGRNTRRYLARLTDRLLGIRRNDWFDPRARRGPKQVLPGLWVTNLFGLGAFARNHPDGLVLSLCDIEGRIDDHAQQITFHLDDTPNQRSNPSLQIVLDDVLGEIRHARAVGQPVLLHCRHGASRTGLVLRLLLVEEQGLSATEALIEAECLWSHTSSWNKAWNREVERRAQQR